MTKILSLDDRGNNNLSRELRRDVIISHLLSPLYHMVPLRGMFRSYCYSKRSSSEGLLLVQGPIASKGKTREGWWHSNNCWYLLCSSTVLSTFTDSSNGY